MNPAQRFATKMLVSEIVTKSRSALRIPDMPKDIVAALKRIEADAELIEKTMETAP